MQVKPWKEQEGVHNTHIANTEAADTVFLAGEGKSVLSIISL